MANVSDTYPWCVVTIYVGFVVQFAGQVTDEDEDCGEHFRGEDIYGG